MSLKEKASKIKAVVLDVDGVLTDCRIGYSETEHEIKFFNVRDGLGISLARKSGLLVGILSGRTSQANRIRAKELKLDFIYERKLDKAEALKQLCSEFNITPDECFYVGDDLIDIPPAKISGISVAVADAAPELVSICSFQTKAKGGKGAVREAVEWLLKEQGKWNEIIQNYLK